MTNYQIVWKTPVTFKDKTDPNKEIAMSKYHIVLDDNDVGSVYSKKDFKIGEKIPCELQKDFKSGNYKIKACK